MSYTETHFGKLRKVELKEGQTVEEWCQEKCNENGKIELPSYFKNWVEVLKYGPNSQKYFFNGDEIWEVFDHIESEDGDIYFMQKNEDGTMTFIMQFYNGGTCLSECIEDELAKFKK